MYDPHHGTTRLVQGIVGPLCPLDLGRAMADAVAACEPTAACEFAALDRARAPGLRAHASWLAPVAVGALLRAGYMLYAEGDPGDGISRTITAYEWLGGGRPLFGAHPWPELNYLIPALAIRITGELYWGVRVLYMVLALAVIPLAYRIAA